MNTASTPPTFRLPCPNCKAERELTLYWNRHDQIKVICAKCRAYIKFAAINDKSIALCVNPRPKPGEVATGIPSTRVDRFPTTPSLFGDVA